MWFAEHHGSNLMASAAPVCAQTPMGDPLDARDSRRLDKMEDRKSTRLNSSHT